MRRVPESELDNAFEREYPWGDDQRHLYHPNRRRAAVFEYHLRLETVLDLVRRYSPGPRLGDLACAQGNFGLLAAEAGFDVTAVDIHPDFLRHAQKKHERGAFRTIRANAIEYRAPEQGRFDCVLLGEVIEHVADPGALLAAAFENLNPGGVVILTTPNGAMWGSTLPTFSQVTDFSQFVPKQFHWGDHLFLYTEQELRDVLSRAGFETIKIEKINSRHVSEIRAARYLLPLRALQWLERKTRHIARSGHDMTGTLVAVAKKPQSPS